MRRSSPIVLLTDFGARDAYAATMKGVLLRLAPGSPVVDLSHSTGAYAVDEAAYLLWSSYRFFPRGTVFVAVVDPGVGTKRRIACLKTPSYAFLAPDNGILKFIVAKHPKAPVYAVEASRLGLRGVSATFHGRDIFAPAAARLARGSRPGALGARIRLGAEAMVDLRRTASREIEGRVLHVDAFGNIVTNILAPSRPGAWSVRIGRGRVTTAMARTYATQPTRKPFLLRGSSGLLEISINQRSAASALRARTGQKVIVCRD